MIQCQRSGWCIRLSDQNVCILCKVSNRYKWTSLTLNKYISLSLLYYICTKGNLSQKDIILDSFCILQVCPTQTSCQLLHSTPCNTFQQNISGHTQLLCASRSQNVHLANSEDEKCLNDSVRSSMQMIMCVKLHCVPNRTVQLLSWRGDMWSRILRSVALAKDVELSTCLLYSFKLYI